jgi:hypothetical protein
VADLRETAAFVETSLGQLDKNRKQLIAVRKRLALVRAIEQLASLLNRQQAQQLQKVDARWYPKYLPI